MSVYPIPHDEHVYQRENFLNKDLNALKPLTVERAVQWLSYPTWKRHEAILIFDGHDPESRRFYDEDGASVSVAQLLHQGLPLQMERPFKFYFNWIKKHRIPLPSALQKAMEIVNISEVARLPHLTPAPQVPPAPQAPPSTEIGQGNSTVSGKRNILVPVIEHAQSRCKDQWDYAEVWCQLQTLAAQKYPPLHQMTQGELTYEDGGEIKTLTRKNLGKRLKRKKEKSTNATADR